MWGEYSTELNVWQPVFPNGMREKNSPSITVIPVFLRSSETLHSISSQSSYLISNGLCPAIICIWFVEA